MTALKPDVILAHGTPAVTALRAATRTIPVVFVSVIDPVGAGHVQSLARPGGNITGFSTFEPEIGGKWLELLKGVAPDLNKHTVAHSRGCSAARAGDDRPTGLGTLYRLPKRGEGPGKPEPKKGPRAGL
jgi:ABC-type uncharacterized transport system substrate-binding protein